MAETTPNIKPDESQDVRTAKAEQTAIFEGVEYLYTSYAQFITSNIDFRIALGDRIPPEGKVKPRIGLVMSHDHARHFLRAMTEHVTKMEQLLESLKAPGAEPKAE